MNSRPFLKWPGGKYRLVDRISKALGEGLSDRKGSGKRLIEPFMGSGAVFLNTDYDHYLLADNNPDLINLYGTLHHEGVDFIDFSRQLFNPDTNNAETYYEYRAIFNTTEDIRYKAALFIYLNRHCYNGLCRYNKSGQFNTPFGRYKNPTLPEDSMHTFMQKSKHATFSLACFSETMLQAKKGDVIYCDPPYMPLTKTANFTNYSAAGFDISQQEKLAQLAVRQATKGIRVVISNHDTPEVRKLYSKAKITALQVSRFISQDTNNRNKASEVIAVFDN